MHQTVLIEKRDHLFKLSHAVGGSCFTQAANIEVESIQYDRA